MEFRTSTTAPASEVVPGVLLRTRCGWFGEVTAACHRIDDHQVHFEFRNQPPEIYGEFELLEIELCPPEM